MEFRGKTVVITGGASGIGAALAAAVQGLGAGVALVDVDKPELEATATAVGCLGLVCDVTREADLRDCIAQIMDTLGPIDVFVSNAGIFAGQSEHAASASDAVWMQNWSLHVMAHVYAARILLPDMLTRGSGYFVNITSAAGLLNQIGDAAYSATKHAAVSFAESLAISHGDFGIGVSVVCPQYVATPLIGLSDADATPQAGLLTAHDVARSIIVGVEAERFMILPHPDIAQFAQQRAADHDRWIEGMRRLKAKSVSQLGEKHIAELYRLD